MLPRLLGLLYLLFLSQALLSQQSGTAGPNSIPATCPVTEPYQTSLFVPPPPHPPKAPAGNFWFGSDTLWTVLRVDGRWEGLPHYTPTDPTFRQKLFFYRQGYFARMERKPHLIVTGKRLDSPAPPLLSDGATNGLHGDQQFMVVGINLPTLGCWEIKGRYQDDELTFVVWVSR